MFQWELGRVMSFRDGIAGSQGWLARNRQPVVLLCLLLGFHLCANLWWLSHDHHAIGSDEAMHMEFARTYHADLTDASKPLVARMLTLSTHENLYGPLLHLLGVLAIALFGYSTDVIAATGTVLFMLLIVGIYALARELFDKRQALLATFAASFTPIVYGSSRYFMTDFMATVVVVWAMYCLFRSRFYQRTGWVLAFAVLTGLGILVRQTTFLYYLLPCGAVIIVGFVRAIHPPSQEKGEAATLRALLLNLALTVVVTVGLAAPWYLLQLRYQYTFWTGARGQDHLVLSMRELVGRIPVLPVVLLALLAGVGSFLKKRMAPETFKKRLRIAAFVALLVVLLVPTKWATYPVHAINSGVFLPMFLLAFVGMLVAFEGRYPRFAAAMFLLWVLGSYVLMTVLFKGATPRYILPVMPAFGLFAVVALMAIPQEKRRRIAMAGFCGLLVFQYGNLTFGAYGALARIELPLGSKNFHQSAYGDNGIALYKDLLVTGNYGLAAAQRHEAYTDRILKTMIRDMATRRPIREEWANYQRLSDAEQFEGLYFEERHYWPPPNPFMTKNLKPEELPSARLRAIGSRWYRDPKDLLENLPVTDFVVFRVSDSPKAQEREQSWQRFYESKGFEAIDSFLEEKHNIYPAASYTLMGRKVREWKVLKGWDFSALEMPQWEWNFGKAAQKTPEGAVGVLEANGTGPQSEDLKLRAKDIGLVRVEMSVAQLTAGEERPAEIERAHVYWARPRDMKGAAWPFANERGLALRRVDEKNPGVWEAGVERHQLWTGMIQRLFIGIDTPALEPKELTTLKRWDFATLNKGQWEWAFEGGAEQGAKGAIFLTRQNGPVARLRDLELEAGEVTVVRVQMSATHKSMAGELPVDIEKAHFYWARTSDVQGDGWPFADDRAVPFSIPEADAPDIWEAVVAGHGHWNGPIAQMFIGVDLPISELAADTEHFIVYLTAIELQQSSVPLQCRLLTKRIELLN